MSTSGEEIKYYAIVDRWSSPESPAGLARRRRPPTGGFRDEAIDRNLTWQFTPLIVEWERAESTDDLIEISATDADRIVEGFRAKWAAQE
jgi:hypothetical protein